MVLILTGEHQLLFRNNMLVPAMPRAGVPVYLSVFSPVLDSTANCSSVYPCNKRQVWILHNF
jgi:hypothetical protein